MRRISMFTVFCVVKMEDLYPIAVSLRFLSKSLKP